MLIKINKKIEVIKMDEELQLPESLQLQEENIITGKNSEWKGMF